MLITVEASELQESPDEPRPTKIRRRDTHQFQITSIFSQGGACEQWSKIHIDLSDGLHGPSIPPELTTEELRSQTWGKVACLGTRQGALILAKQVLGTFGKVDSILEASACVQLTGSPPRFAKLIAFVKQQDHGALIHAAIYMCLNSIDHPEHECLLHASRSSNITLALIEDIKGSVPVVPYFATAQYSPRDFRYSQFIIDVRLIWRLGGNLRIDTRVNEVKR